MSDPSSPDPSSDVKAEIQRLLAISDEALKRSAEIQDRIKKLQASLEATKPDPKSGERQP